EISSSLSSSSKRHGSMRAIAPVETASAPSHFVPSLSVIPNRMRNALSSSAAATLAGKAPTWLFGFLVDGRNQAMRAMQVSSRIKLKKRDMESPPAERKLVQL